MTVTAEKNIRIQLVSAFGCEHHLGHSIAFTEQRVNISCSMEHSHDLHAIVDRQIEHQVIRKMLDAPHTHADKSRIRKMAQLPHLSILGQESKRLFRSIHKSLGNLDTSFTKIVD